MPLALTIKTHSICPSILKEQQLVTRTPFQRVLEVSKLTAFHLKIRCWDLRRQ